MKYHQCNSEAELFEIKYAHHRSRCVWSEGKMNAYLLASACGHHQASLRACCAQEAVAMIAHHGPMVSLVGQSPRIWSIVRTKLYKGMEKSAVLMIVVRW